MKRYLTPTFGKFLFAFLCIIGVAFGVVIVISSQTSHVAPVDNVALPQ